MPPSKWLLLLLMVLAFPVAPQSDTDFYHLDPVRAHGLRRAHAQLDASTRDIDERVFFHAPYEFYVRGIQKLEEYVIYTNCEDKDNVIPRDFTEIKRNQTTYYHYRKICHPHDRCQPGEIKFMSGDQHKELLLERSYVNLSLPFGKRPVAKWRIFELCQEKLDPGKKITFYTFADRLHKLNITEETYENMNVTEKEGTNDLALALLYQRNMNDFGTVTVHREITYTELMPQGNMIEIVILRSPNTLKKRKDPSAAFNMLFDTIIFTTFCTMAINYVGFRWFSKRVMKEHGPMRRRIEDLTNRSF